MQGTCRYTLLDISYLLLGRLDGAQERVGKEKLLDIWLRYTLFC